MDKAGGVFIYFHTYRNERLVISTRNIERIFFIGNMRQYYADIHAAFRRIFYRINDGRVDYEIRRHDIDIFTRAIENIEKNALGDILFIYRVVGEGNAVALSRRIVGKSRKILFRIVVGIFTPAREIPHFQKHLGEALDTAACNLYGGILPVTVRMRLVYVFVGDVYASGEGDLAVYDDYLSVIAIIEL